jgi:hypothetical protein
LPCGSSTSATFTIMVLVWHLGAAFLLSALAA